MERADGLVYALGRSIRSHEGSQPSETSYLLPYIFFWLPGEVSSLKSGPVERCSIEFCEGLEQPC